jgi:hypothetical protein
MARKGMTIENKIENFPGTRQNAYNHRQFWFLVKFGHNGLAMHGNSSIFIIKASFGTGGADKPSRPQYGLNCRRS